MLTDSQRTQRIAVLREFPARLAALIAGLSAEQLTTPYLAHEWTVAQNVHHLVDSHANSYIRLKLILTEENPPLKPYDQDLWAAFPDASQADVSDSLAILRGLHARMVNTYEHVQGDQWARVGNHAVNGAVRVDDLLVTYSDHCDAHIDQITRTLAAGGISR
jgi:hypothetical protein